MTSVQNHRLPLSGNKWILLLLLLAGLWSCSAARYTTGQEYTPIITTPIENTTPPTGENAIEETQEIQVVVLEKAKAEEEKFNPGEASIQSLTTKNPTERYTAFDVPSSIKKDTYTIALILPFQLEKVPNTVADPRTVTFTTQTKIAAEFYQGAMEALDSLKSLPVNLKVYVVDLDGDTINAKSKLTEAPFPDVDLIIGPVYNSNLRIYARYAREHMIPIISPMSSSSTITSSNPYYFSANATARTHYYSLLKKILEDEPTANLWVLKGNNTETEEADFVADIFKDDFATLYPAAKLKHIKYTSSDSLLFSRHFSTNRTNHLIIPSYNPTFIQDALNLTTKVDSLIPVRIYGTPKWSEYKVDFGVNKFVSVYITSSYFNNPTSTFAKNFRETYEEENRRYPSEYTQQGYDLLWYAGNVLAAGDFFSGIEQGLTFSKEGFLQTEFSFAPIYSKDDPWKIDYFDNKFVHWLYYSNGKFNKAW